MIAGDIFTLWITKYADHQTRSVTPKMSAYFNWRNYSESLFATNWKLILYVEQRVQLWNVRLRILIYELHLCLSLKCSSVKWPSMKCPSLIGLYKKYPSIEFMSMKLLSTNWITMKSLSMHCPSMKCPSIKCSLKKFVYEMSTWMFVHEMYIILNTKSSWNNHSTEHLEDKTFN